MSLLHSCSYIQKRQRKDKIVRQSVVIDLIILLFCSTVCPFEPRNTDPAYHLAAMKYTKNEVRANGSVVQILLAHAITPVCFTFPFSLPRFIIPYLLALTFQVLNCSFMNSLFRKDSLHLLMLCLLYRNFYLYSGSLGANR